MRFLDEGDVRAMRSDGDLLKWIKMQMREGLAKAEARRASVLRYPDLAQKLTEQPVNCQSPEQWTGAMPPEKWRDMPNDSPLRPVLLELVAEAERRDREAEAKRRPIASPPSG